MLLARDQLKHQLESIGTRRLSKHFGALRLARRGACRRLFLIPAEDRAENAGEELLAFVLRRFFYRGRRLGNSASEAEARINIETPFHHRLGRVAGEIAILENMRTRICGGRSGTASDCDAALV